jgi:hypothetical protein
MGRSLLLDALLTEDPEAARQQVWMYDRATATGELRRRVGLASADVPAASEQARALGMPWTPEPWDWRGTKLGRLLWHFGLDLEEPPTPALLTEAALKVERRSVDLLRRLHAPGKTPTGAEAFEGTTTEALVRHVGRALFRRIQEGFDALPEAERLRLAEAFARDLSALPPEVQERVRAEARLANLSADAFRTGAAIGAAGGALVGTVGMAGFAAYTTLTSTVAGLAGLFGLTLPFAFYTTATSLLAGATSMTVLGPAALLGGAWLARRTTGAMRDQLVPMLVGMTVLSGDRSGDLPAALDAFCAHLRRRRLPDTFMHSSTFESVFWFLPKAVPAP